MHHTSVLDQPIGIIGAGVAGLINAHVLLQDGFTDVTLISRDESVGGTWARKRVYSGLRINHVHGEYRFSALEMPPPQIPDSAGYLSGMDIRDYVEKFSSTFLDGKAKFRMQTEVLDIRRDEHETWKIKIQDHSSNISTFLTFSRIILATGGCSSPHIPESLSHEATDKMGYRGLVIHSSDFAARYDDILAAVKPIAHAENLKDEGEMVLVIGGGKSAQDVCAKLTSEGRRTAIVYNTTDVFIAAPTPAPEFMRKSRFFNVFSPHVTLNTRLERFLHTTTVGSAITRGFWNNIADMPFKAYNIPKDSPLRRTPHVFWTTRASDEGIVRPNSFHALANTGAIEVIAPARMLGYSNDRASVLLSNGRFVRAKVVVLATGYKSSWTQIFTPEVAEDIGLSRHAPKTNPRTSWDYMTLKGGPPPNPDNELWTSSVYRGLVPAKNIERRDFAIAGAAFSANFLYTNEVAAHWIASYFRSDEMRIPSSAEEALRHAEERAAWMKFRFPDELTSENLSNSTTLDFFTWPQAADELLNDMYVPSMRSGGNWFNWVFKIIDSKELATLTEERRARRQPSS